MFLITYKKGLNAEKSKIEFDRPLTFFDANEMLLEAVTKYKQSGQSMKISYKIVEMESGESVFNSKIIIDRDIPSLFQLIKENSSTPKVVIDYVKKVENREINETEDSFSFNNHVEEKVRLEQLKTEKNDILQQLKKDEKERQQRDIEFQRKMQEIQDEKKALEKALQLKEKEEAVKESQRIEALRKLEEEKINAMKLMEEKRNLDKKKKDEHEQRLKEVEDEAKKAELELASIETELEKNELERKKELQELETKKVEADRKVSILKAESDIEEVQHQQDLIDYKKIDKVQTLPQENYQTTVVVPKMTFKEKLQELDFEEVKSLSIRLVRSGAKSSVNGSKKAFVLMKNYHLKRAAEKQEKLKNLNKKVEIEEKLALEKIKFMEELKKEKLNQEKELRRAARQKEREESKQAKIEDRYRAAKKKSLGRIPIYGSGSLKFLFSTVAFVVISIGCINYFNLGDKFPILSEVQNYVENVKNMILNMILKS
ncbi:MULTISPECIES: hypothetical protein [Bacillaceae]|uniref:hypothetical protein n=1 Tax=Bacillaceae TaxID=186817 RepID=UPI000BFDA0BC|nr:MULTISPECIES: hypothetical protein [Bacillaceae]MCM3032560.1 hypothetical protein [Niallia sp. MER 6]PGT80983.1 hypothetical protein COD11_19230 [Bacillus sp. AFS040349]